MAATRRTMIATAADRDRSLRMVRLFQSSIGWGVQIEARIIQDRRGPAQSESTTLATATDRDSVPGLVIRIISISFGTEKTGQFQPELTKPVRYTSHVANGRTD